MPPLVLPCSVMHPRVIFSAIQPTGVPHLGNYVGALRQWVRLQRDLDIDSQPPTRLLFSIADLHAITTPQAPEQLKRWKRESLAAVLAVGIDPQRSILFYQSSVPAHSELMWILACTASLGYLSRMTQWKQKTSPSTTSADPSFDSPDSPLKLGLLSYPVLQAADILVHRATHVPVGHDQRQHLEFARECVTNFNHAYGPCLVYPETIIPPVHRVMSLSDPTSKMSKSHPSQRSRILITDTAQEIRAKISSSLTDSLPGISYEPTTRPGIANLLDIFSIFDLQLREPSQLAEEYAQAHPRHFKDAVSDAIIHGLKGIRDRYLQLLHSENDYLDQVEADGARQARQRADETMQVVKQAIGL